MSPVDYHGWTHAPKSAGGTDPIPGLGATLESGVAFDAGVTGTTSINNNTLTSISFDNVFVSTGATAIAIEQNPTTTQPLQLIGEGWFLLSFSFKWASAPATALYQVDPDFPAENMAHDVAQVELATNFGVSVEHSFGPLYFNDWGSPNTLLFRVQHAFGSSRAVTAVMFSVVYLGPDIDEASFPLFS